MAVLSHQRPKYYALLDITLQLHPLDHRTRFRFGRRSSLVGWRWVESVVRYTVKRSLQKLQSTFSRLGDWPSGLPDHCHREPQAV